jgi:two-component system chemotaxis response regulator CheB
LNRQSSESVHAHGAREIGTSTGGPKALQEILSKIPVDIPAGLIIDQHMPRGFTGPFAQRL